MQPFCPQALSEVERKRRSVLLQRTNLANPRPGSLYVLWRSQHPPLAERIQFANRYRPWEKGQPLAYGRYFGEP